MRLFTEQMKLKKISSIQIEKRYQREVGSIIWALLSSQIIQDKNGENSQQLAIIHDISEVVETHNQLAETNEEMAKRNQEQETFNQIAIARELQNVEIKRQVKRLAEARCSELFDLSFPGDLNWGQGEV